MRAGPSKGGGIRSGYRAGYAARLARWCTRSCGRPLEALSAGGEESAEEATGFEFLEACLPGLGGGAEAIENPGQLGGDHRLAFAKEPAGVVDEEQVVSQ